MRLAIVVGVAVALGLAGCGGGADKCGDQVCTASQRCTATKVCVTDTPPTLTVDTPAEGTMVTTTSIELKGSASDDDKAPVVEVSTDGASWNALLLGADGTFTTTVMLPDVDASSLSIAVRARDSKGQEVKVTRSLQVDNVPPSCSITSPADGTAFISNGATVTMIAADGSQVLTNARFSTDGAATFVAPSGNSGTYSFAWSVGSENGVSHDFVFRVDDASGHTCEAKATVSVDNVKPTVAFSTPDAGSILAPAFFSAGGRVGGPVSDGSRMLKSVTLDFADNFGPRAATVQGGLWSAMVPTPVGDDFKSHTATVLATDLAGNTATASLTVTVDVKPPALAITSPANNAKLNIASFPSGNNINLTWTLTDGDSQLNIVLVQADGGTVSPPSLATSSTDNPKAYQATLRASDRSGNTSTASVSFTVDRVAPTMTTTVPVNGTRMHIGKTSADFSEPMTGGAGLAMNPFLTGTWTTPQHYEVTGLAKDTVYQAATGTITDLQGNPVVPSSYSFHTETWMPTSGMVLTTGYSQVAEAAVDPEGWLNLLLVDGPAGRIDWMQFDPATGTPKVVDSYTAGMSAGLLASFRTVQADLSSRRLAGLWSNTGTADQVRYNINGGALVTVPNAQAFIPAPAYNGEGTGLAEFGVISGGLYKRTGRANLAVGVAAPDALHVTDTRWELVQYVAGGTSSQSFGCYQPSVGPVTCALTAVKTLGGGSIAEPSTAASRFCSVHSYENTGAPTATAFRWQPGCGGALNPCATDSTQAGARPALFADPLTDGTFYSASGGLSVTVQKALTPSTTCAQTWTPVGGTLAVGLIPHPPLAISIRGTPAIVFADGNGSVNYLTP